MFRTTLRLRATISMRERAARRVRYSTVGDKAKVGGEEREGAGDHREGIHLRICVRFHLVHGHESRRKRKLTS
jgi:hypothetical protein